MAKIKAKKNTFDKILDVFAWISFSIAVILAILVLFSSFSGKDNGRSVFGCKMLIVESDSMSKSEISQEEPISFNKDDLIFIKINVDVSTIKEGDVITFVSHNPDSSGKTITHKVRAVLTDTKGNLLGFETYGINTGVSDLAIVEPVTVVGIYTGKSSFLGKLFCFFKTPAGYFTSILIPCVLLIIFFSIKVGKLLAKREMHRIYYDEFETLKERLSELEKNREGVFMETDLQVVENTNTPVEEIQQETIAQKVNSGEQAMVNVQPIIQSTSANDKVLEIMANTLANTIQSLTNTIETLANAVGKPVDTLARSIETLATTAGKTVVTERIIEKPVGQNVVKEVVIEPVKKVVEEVAPSKVEVQSSAPIQEEVAVSQDEQAKESTTGGLFSEFQQREKLPFNKKLLSLNSDIKEYFSQVHNELVSYKKVNYRISFKGIAYRVGRTTIAKIVVRGKTLKLHLALDVNGYPKTVYFQEDTGSVKAYEDVPFAVKIKSERAKNNALKLVVALAENNNLVKEEKFKSENILKVLKIAK